jgi:hypothetical protein
MKESPSTLKGMGQCSRGCKMTFKFRIEVTSEFLKASQKGLKNMNYPNLKSECDCVIFGSSTFSSLKGDTMPNFCLHCRFSKYVFRVI